MKKIYTFIFATACAVTLLSLSTGCSDKSNQATESQEVDILSKRTAFWNSWTAKCFPDKDWSKTTFTTEGKDYVSFTSDDPIVWEEMRNVYIDTVAANQYLPGVVNSGSSYPASSYASSGELFYKIVPPKGNIQGPSPYYVTEEQLEWIKAHPDELEQKLGLPLSSVSGEYWIYSITSKVDSNIIFQSTIAPTVQYATATPDITYSTPGGATQSLIINNSDSLLWLKAKTPTEKYIPNCLPKIEK